MEEEDRRVRDMWDSFFEMKKKWPIHVRLSLLLPPILMKRNRNTGLLRSGTDLLAYRRATSFFIAHPVVRYNRGKPKKLLFFCTGYWAFFALPLTSLFCTHKCCQMPDFIGKNLPCLVFISLASFTNLSALNWHILS